MKNVALLFALSLLALSACKNNPNAANGDDMANASPEEVVRQLETLVATNKYKEAKALCTNESLDWVNSLEAANDLEPIEASKSIILSINCSEQGDKATCSCLIEEDAIQTTYNYQLLRSQERWLVSMANVAEPASSSPDTSSKVEEYDQIIESSDVKKAVQ